MPQRFTRQDGVSLIIVAILLVVLCGLATFSVDLGQVWVARVAAQNAADAGALAGAAGRAYDDLSANPGPSSLPYQAAVAAVQLNTVVLEVPNPEVSWDCPPWLIGPARCVQVDVYRDGTHGSTILPAFFARVFAASTRERILGTKASATARVFDGNHANCLKPWLIPDKYTEVTPPATAFNGSDTYTAPGYTLQDVGTVLVLKPGDPRDAAAPSNYYEIGDANLYEDSIIGCKLFFGIGDTVQTLPGNRVGPTKQGVGILTANGPVVVPIGMFSPAEWAALPRTTGRFTIRVVNILGFKITGISGNGTVTGEIATLPGELVSGTPTAPTNAAFLKVVELIR